MNITIEAVYENGVFRPLSTVELKEGERVFVTVPFHPAELQSREEVDELVQDARKTFQGLSDEEIDDISEGWKRE